MLMIATISFFARAVNHSIRGLAGEKKKKNSVCCEASGNAAPQASRTN